MNSRSPKSLALGIAAGITALFLLLGFALLYGWIPSNVTVIISFAVIIFVIAFVVIRLLLFKYIQEKIIPIYRVIRKSGVKEKPTSNPGNPIDQMYEVVDEWVHDKESEIKSLKANARFRQEFIGNVSHELKTPIFSIQGYILTLLEGGLDDPDINHSYLQKAEKSVERMINIIKDLEYISRVETGELELHKENFDLNKLITDVYELHEVPAKKSKITLKTSFRGDRKYMVHADKKRIQEVLSNLVINAINYGSQDGYVQIEILDMERYFLVEVSDNGPGISEEDQKRIFERFYRVDKSRSRNMGGTGLGLAIAKHFVEAHGQRLNVQSELGKGTAFAFTLLKA